VTAGVYREQCPGSALGALQQVLELAPAAEVIEKKLRIEGVRTGRVSALELPGQIAQGLALGILTPEEAATLRHYDELVMDIVNVDEFEPDELGTHSAAPSAVR
jgi:acyl-CoA dehydrogenase